MKFNSKKSAALAALLVVVGIAGIAFAALSVNLYISGTAKVNNNDFSVIWQEDSMSCTATGEATVGVEGNTDTVATVEAEFQMPNDTVTCTVVAENDGTLPAEFVAANLASSVSNLTAIDVTATVTTPAGTTVADHSLAAAATRQWQIVLTYTGAGVTTDTAPAAFSFTIPYVESE